MLEHVRNGWAVDDLVPEFTREVKSLVAADDASWKNVDAISEHTPLLQRAADRYLEDDFISAASILYPRIEGIMRTYHLRLAVGEEASSRTLTQMVVNQGAGERHESSLLLPDRFRQYLSDVYFAGFEPGEQASMSRSSVAHGVASAQDFSEKAATIGWLTLLQTVLFAESGAQGAAPAAQGGKGDSSSI